MKKFLSTLPIAMVIFFTFAQTASASEGDDQSPVDVVENCESWEVILIEPYPPEEVFIEITPAAFGDWSQGDTVLGSAIFTMIGSTEVSEIVPWTATRPLECLVQSSAPAEPTPIDKCGTEEDGYDIPPSTEAYAYVMVTDGFPKGGGMQEGFHPYTGTVGVIVNNGFVLPAGTQTQWTHEFNEEECVVVGEPPVPPTTEAPVQEVIKSLQIITAECTNFVVRNTGNIRTLTGGNDVGYHFLDSALPPNIILLSPGDEAHIEVPVGKTIVFGGDYKITDPEGKLVEGDYSFTGFSCGIGDPAVSDPSSDDQLSTAVGNRNFIKVPDPETTPPTPTTPAGVKLPATGFGTDWAINIACLLVLAGLGLVAVAYRPGRSS